MYQELEHRDEVPSRITVESKMTSTLNCEGKPYERLRLICGHRQRLRGCSDARTMVPQGGVTTELRGDNLKEFQRVSQG